MAHKYIPVIMHTPELIQQAVEQCAEYAQEQETPPLMEDLIYRTGISQSMMSQITTGELINFADVKLSSLEVKNIKESANIIQKYASLCRSSVLRHGFRKGFNPAMPIFYAKVALGYKESPNNNNNIQVIIDTKHIPD